MNSRVFSILAVALSITAGVHPLLAVDLRSADPLPPVPPGSSMPPPTSSSSVSGQANATSTGSQMAFGSQGVGGGQHNPRLQKLKNALDLSPAQIARIRPIVTHARQRIQAIRAHAAMPENQKNRSIREVLVASMQRIRPILTPQQLQKWQQLRQEKHRASERTTGTPSSTSR